MFGETPLHSPLPEKSVLRYSSAEGNPPTVIEFKQPALPRGRTNFGLPLCAHIHLLCASAGGGESNSATLELFVLLYFVFFFI